MPKEEPEKLVNSIFGINLFNVRAVAEKVASYMEYDGIAPRWLFFANLIDPLIPENRILSTISVINSAKEIKIGLGKHFESTKVIRER